MLPIQIDAKRIVKIQKQVSSWFFMSRCFQTSLFAPLGGKMIQFD